MNIGNTKDYIKVMQAFLDGEEIEYRMTECEGDRWSTNNSPLWSFGEFSYRVKPQPREYNVYLNASDQPFDVTHATVDTKQGMRTVHVREVVE